MQESYDSQDAVPESLREHYVEHKGKFVPKFVVGLLSNRDELLGEVKKTKATLAQYEGVDPEKHKELVKKAEEDERKRNEEAGNYKALQEQLITKHQQEMQGAKGIADKYRLSLEKYLVDAALTQAITSGTAPGVPELLLPHMKQHIKVVEKDGEFSAVVVDAQGNPRIANAKGEPMTLPNLVDEFRQNEIFARCFAAPQIGGSGASNQSRSLGAVRTVKANDHRALSDNLEAIAEGKVVVTNS